MTTIKLTSFKIAIEIANKGPFCKLRIVKEYYTEQGIKDSHTDIVVEFGNYFDNEEACNTFMKGKLFKSVLKDIQKHAIL